MPFYCFLQMSLFFNCGCITSIKVGACVQNETEVRRVLEIQYNVVKMSFNCCSGCTRKWDGPLYGIPTVFKRMMLF